MKVNETGRPILWINRPTLKGISIAKCCLRPGALDILSKPSRIGQTLFFPNGKVTK